MTRRQPMPDLFHEHPPTPLVTPNDIALSQWQAPGTESPLPRLTPGVSAGDIAS